MNSRVEVTAGQRGLHAFAVLTTLATFVLIATGGLVTSKGAGMAVPDWPTSFGYNMFALPWDRWVGGVFYEHFHRVVASGVGLLTVVLAVWVFVVDRRRAVRILALAAVAGVIVQGMLGGFRVTMIMKEIGIFHGMLAQAFFVTLGVLTAVTSPGFLRGSWAPTGDLGRVRWAALGLTVLIFLQLGIGATMRHAHLGLAIPDFPLAYGAVWPDTSPAAVAAINEARMAAIQMPTTAFQIWLQMAHRGMAVLIAVGVGYFALVAWRAAGGPGFLRWWSGILVGMISVQIALGAWTIWRDKAADIATAHMALGALTLFVCGVLTFRLFVMARGEHAGGKVVQLVPQRERVAI